MLLNPFEVHQCHIINASKTTYCSLSIPIDVMNKYIESSNKEDNYLLFQNSIIANERLATKFLKLQYHILENPDKSFNKKLLFDHFINELVSKYTMLRNTLPIPNNPIISSVHSYIEKNYHKNFTIEEMCKHLNIKVSTLFFHFNKEVGITPQRYVMNMRIIAAKQLLKDAMPITKVALAVGFYDHSHFTNFFKRIEGITPLEYAHAFSS